MEEFEKKITDLNEDETFQSWMTREEDQIVMFNTEKEMAYESGMNQGLTKGIEQGISEGISRGEEKAKLEDAKNMLKKGLEVSLIMEITGLTKEKIDSLKD